MNGKPKPEMESPAPEEEALDEGLDDTFPASDPVAPESPTIVRKPPRTDPGHEPN